MGWDSGVKGQAAAKAARPAGPPPPKAPFRFAAAKNGRDVAELGPTVCTVDAALAWYERGRQDGIAAAAAYLRQCGRDEWAAGLEAALGAKEGD